MSSRILIVEDQFIVAADLEAKLVKLGYKVIGTAASGEEAIELAEQRRPDVVLMDIQLQGRMTGTEAAQRIRQETGSAIIFVTAFAAVFLRDPAIMQPPGLCLSKPFSTLQLKSALESVLKDPLIQQ